MTRPLSRMYVAGGVRRELGVWGRKSPSGVQGQSPCGGLGAKPPEAIGTL